MPSSRALIGDDIRTCWREFAPVLIELARHNLPLLDWAWKAHPGWRTFRDTITPMLLGTPYMERLQPMRRRAGGAAPLQLDPELVDDTHRCVNLMRAKIWGRLGARCSVRESEAMIDQIMRWLEHLTLSCSVDSDLIQMDFALDMPDVGTVVHHNSRYGLTYASAAGAAGSLIPEAAVKDRLNAILNDKFKALRDWLDCQPNGIADLRAHLAQIAFDLEERRFGDDARQALPEYVSVSFSAYDGEVREVIQKRARVTKRSAATTKPFDERAVVASMHVRRAKLLNQRRQQGLCSALRDIAPQPQDAFDSVAVMAKRWRWLISNPHALSTLRSILESLPVRTFTDPRQVLEYVNLQVDLTLLDTGWGDSGEFADVLDDALQALQLDRQTHAPEVEPPEGKDERRASTWWLWFSVAGAQHWTKRSSESLDQAEQPLRSAIARARQKISDRNSDFDELLDAALREAGHAPEGLLTPARADPFYSDMLRALSPPRRATHTSQTPIAPPPFIKRGRGRPAARSV